MINEKPSADVTSHAHPATESAAVAPKRAVAAASERASGRYWFVFDRWLPMASGADQDDFVLA